MHSVDSCKTCEPGMLCGVPVPGDPGGLTSGCPANHYCPQGSKKARVCPPGTYTDGLNKKSEDECPSCSPGKSCYHPVGSTPSTPEDCKPGYYCLARTYFPHETPCPDGTFTSSTGQSACTPCSTPGKYCLEGSSAEKDCEKGYSCSNEGKMEPCPAGYHSHSVLTNDGKGASACYECIPGYICPGGYHEVNPIKCPAGTFMDASKSEATSCKLCTEGHKCDTEGMSAPDPCPSKQWSIKGQTVCSDCPAGFYCPAPMGATKELIECPPGKHCPKGSDAPISCRAGYYCLAGSAAELQCPPGTESAAESSACTAVSSGSYSERKDTSYDIDILTCQEGFYCESGSQTKLSKLCPPGTYSTDGARSVDDCLPCTEGFYCPGGTGGSVKVECPVGHYCPENSVIPTKCEIGSYGSTTGLVKQDDCTKCTAGKACTQRGLTAPDKDCDPGYYCTLGASNTQPTDGTTGDICTVGSCCEGGVGAPVPCVAGTFNVFTGCKSNSECLDCPFGFVCDGNDGSKQNCPQGLYCEGGSTTSSATPAEPGYHTIEGQGAPIPCLPGTFTSASSQHECAACTAGFTCPASTTGDPLVPLQVCAAGSYCETGSVSSKLCLEGTYRSSTGAASKDDCKKCDASYACETIGMTGKGDECKAGFFCAEGSFSTTPSHTEYSDPGNVAIFGPCPAGSYCETGTATPQPCPERTFSPALMAMKQGDCNSCLPGEFCAAAGLTEPSGFCPIGYYCPSGTKDDTEHQCSQGYYCPAKSAFARECSAGFYQNQPGMSTCEDCPQGKYCGKGSTNDGDNCPAGYFCPANTGYYQLNPCPPGTFSGALNLYDGTQCTTCTAGKYCQGYKNTAVGGDCEAGYYCKEGSTSSRPTNTNEGNKCTAGFYCPAGSTDETPCPQYFVCNAEMLDTAPTKKCSDGYKCGTGLAYTNPTGLEDKGSGLCDPGNWCKEGEMKPCDKGTYLPSKGAGKVAGAGECLKCPFGHYCADDGMATTSGPCSEGHFCPGEQQVPNANECAQGFKCTNAAVQQVPCDPGTYQDATAQSSCKACDAGNYCQYNSATGTIGQTVCEEGMYCPTNNMDGALPCAPQTYQSGTGALTCTACTDGNFCDRYGLEAETPCPEGYYCAAGQESGRLHICEPGFYCPANSKEPKKCDKGFYCADYGLGAPTDVCEPGYVCYAGSKVPNPTDGTQGHMCIAGHYCPNGKDEKPCHIGTYNEYTGASSEDDCVLCLEGMKCLTEGLVSPVSPLNDCPAGYFCKTVEGANPGDPLTLHENLCTKGHMCPAKTSEEILCLPGTYQPDDGKDTCEPCPQGSYCDFDTSLSPVITVLKDCPPGFYCPPETGDYSIYPCPEGTFNPNTKLKAKSECTQCTEGSYCIKKGLDAVSGLCKDGYLCPVGSILPMKDTEMCPKNHYCQAGQSTECSAETYTFETTLGATSASDCMKCLPGKLCADHDNGIASCPAGSFCKDGIKSDCTKGHYCPGNVGEPLSCEVGSYSGSVGTDKCALCEDGYYCSSVKMETQTQCGANMVCNQITDIGSTREMPCTYGKQKVTDSTCAPCTAGKWCWPSLTDNLQGDCDNGYVCSGGASSPRPYNTEVKTSDDDLTGYNGRAPKGCFTHLTNGGVAAASKCPATTYMPSVGAEECIKCPPGYYCDVDGIYSLVSKKCQEGYVCDAGSSTGSPRACAGDHYCPSGTSFDVPCEDGYMSLGTGNPVCELCEVAHSCTHSSPHTPCAANNEACVLGTGVEPLCQPGTYLSGSACVPCPAGLFCVDGRSEATSAGCGTTANHGQCCTAGYICTGGSLTSKPTSNGGHTCNVGYYCPEGTTAEQECVINKYIFDKGSKQESDCTDCMEGFVCQQGSSTYEPCPKGNYCPTGITGSEKCPVGTYSMDAGLKIVHGCVSCPEGYLCSQEGTVDYSDYECPTGHYCFKRALSEITCPYGTYNDQTGGSSIKSCKACPEGYYCPKLGQSDPHEYKCAGGQMCSTGSANPSICPGGYYCDIDSGIPKEICPVNYYCPPGTAVPIACTFGETCPEGSSYPTKCVAGQISATVDGELQCQDCPPGTYSESGLNTACEVCVAGYVCLGGTNVKYPWNEEVHKGYKCPQGAYCPEGSAAPNYCPAGTYNPIAGSVTSKACLLCKANTYNPIEGQPSCLACGDSASSEEGAAICECKGKNRAFLVSDSSCRCKPGYQYLESGQKHRDSNSKVDCQPIIYPRCTQKQSRSYDGKCTSASDCADSCDGGKGVRSPTLGICQCENIQKVDHVCNRGCRDEMPAMTIDQGKIRINRADDVYNRNPTYVSPKNLENFNADYMSCPSGKDCSTKSVHFDSNGKIGSSYGLSPRLASAYQKILSGGRRLDANFSRRFLESVSSEEIVNPVMCIHQGDSVIFEIDGQGHYPVYQKDSLLNSNQNFDYAPFKILAEQISAQIANGESDKKQFFGYTFNESGRYFFTDSIDTEKTVIVYVTKESEKCASESAYLQPRTTGALSIFGLVLNDSIMLEPDYILMAIIIVSFVFTLAMLLVLMKWVTDHIWKPKDVSNPLFRETQKDFAVNAAALAGTNSAAVSIPEDAVEAADRGIFQDVERADADNLFVPDLIKGINIQKLEELDPFIIEKILGDYQDYKDYLQQELLKGCEQQNKEIEGLSTAIDKVRFMLNERYEKLIELLKLDVDYTKLTNVKIKAEEEKEEIKNVNRKVKPSDIKLCKSEEKKATEMLKKVMAKRNEVSVSSDTYESEEASRPKSSEDATSKVKKEFERQLERVEGLTEFEKEKLRDELSSEMLNLEYVLAGEREQQEIAIRRILQGRRKKQPKKPVAPVDMHSLSPEENALKDKIEQEIDEEGKAQTSHIEQLALSKIQRAKAKLLSQLGAPANLSDNEKNMILQNHQDQMELLLQGIKEDKDKQLEVLRARLERQKREKVEKNIRELREELNPELPPDEPEEVVEIAREVADDSELGELNAEEKRALTELRTRQEGEKKRMENAHEDAFKYKEVELEEDLQLEIEKEMEVKKEKTEEKYRMKQQLLERERRKLKDQLLLHAGSDEELTQRLMEEIKVKDDQLDQLMEQEKKEQNFLLEEKINKRRIAKARKMIDFKNRQQDQAIDLKLEQLKKRQEVQGKFEMEKIRKIVQKTKKGEGVNDEAYKLFEQMWNEKEGTELANMFGRQLAEKESKLRGIYKKNMDQKLMQKKAIKDKYRTLYSDLEMRRIGGKQEEYAGKHKELRIEEENDLKEMDIKEAMSQKKEEFALRQELEEKAANELGELQEKLAREKIHLLRELFSGQRNEEVELQSKIADMKDLIEREKDRKIKDIELNKKLILEKYENDIKQRFSSYEDVIKKQRETEKLIKEKKGSIAKMVEERKKQIAELKDKALFTPEQEKELIEKHQKELKELETAMEAERNRQFLVMKAKLEEKQGQREREQSYNKKKVAFLMGAVGKNITLAQNQRERIPMIAEPRTELERAIERWRKDMEEREKSQKATTFQTLQKYLENVGKFRQKGLEGIYLQGEQYQKYLKLMKASKVLHKKLEELHRIKANGVLLDLKTALQIFAEDDFDRIKARPERIGGGFRCFDEEGNILWELYKFIHDQ